MVVVEVMQVVGGGGSVGGGYGGGGCREGGIHYHLKKILKQFIE